MVVAFLSLLTWSSSSNPKLIAKILLNDFSGGPASQSAKWPSCMEPLLAHNCMAAAAGRQSGRVECRQAVRGRQAAPLAWPAVCLECYFAPWSFHCCSAQLKSPSSSHPLSKSLSLSPFPSPFHPSAPLSLPHLSPSTQAPHSDNSSGEHDEVRGIPMP